MQHLTVLFLLILTQANGIYVPQKGRIIGGQAVDKQDYPYIVSLHYNGRHICGGSILAPDAIMTAAHCTAKGRASKYTIRSGSNSADRGTLHEVYEIHEHPKYNSKTSSYDVSILMITPPITYSNYSQPIKLASERPAEDTLLVISGWGSQKEGFSPSTVQRQQLRAVFVITINQVECARKYRNKKVNSLMMCAASIGKDSCQGDSGGPLVNTRTGEQVGITSWGIGCARPNYPGVYASVPDLLDFIESFRQN